MDIHYRQNASVFNILTKCLTSAKFWLLANLRTEFQICKALMTERQSEGLDFELIVDKLHLKWEKINPISTSTSFKR